MGDRDSFNCLISGASRGIGRALAAHYLILDNTVVVATVRDPESTAARSLISMPAEKNSRIVVIAGYNKSEEITRDGISLLNKQEMIRHLDLVIANAGVPQSKLASLLGAELSELADLVLTNGLGPLMLFRETLPSMRKSKALHGARFVNIGSVTGSSASTSATNSMKMAPMGGETYQQALNIGRVDAVQKTCCPSDLSILSGVATDAFNQLNQSDSIPAEILSPEEAARIIAIVVGKSRFSSHQGGFFQASDNIIEIPY